MKKMMVCLLLVWATYSFANVSSLTWEQAVTLQAEQGMLGLRLSEGDIREEELRIFDEANKLFQFAEDRFNKFLYSTYERDRLALKDFVWSFKGLSDGMNHQIIRPLKALRSNVADDSLLSKAFSIVESVAIELHTGLSKLCNALHPHERTKNKADAYKVAKLLKTHIEGFLSNDRFNKYNKNLDDVIAILATRSGYSKLVPKLEELKKGLNKLGGSTANIEELKVLNRIVNRISHN